MTALLALPKRSKTVAACVLGIKVHFGLASIFGWWQISIRLQISLLEFWGHNTSSYCG
jgi:hypothetical protein